LKQAFGGHKQHIEQLSILNIHKRRGERSKAVSIQHKAKPGDFGQCKKQFSAQPEYLRILKFQLQR
jgi:hypothetical protein